MLFRMARKSFLNKIYYCYFEFWMLFIESYLILFYQIAQYIKSTTEGTHLGTIYSRLIIVDINCKISTLFSFFLKSYASHSQGKFNKPTPGSPIQRHFGYNWIEILQFSMDNQMRSGHLIRKLHLKDCSFNVAVQAIVYRNHSLRLVHSVYFHKFLLSLLLRST